MPNLKVFLVNGVGLSDTVQGTVRTRVAGLLDGTIQRAGSLGIGTGGITGSDVRWVPGCPQGRTRQDVVISFRRPPRAGDDFVCRTTRDGGWEFATTGLTSILGQGTRSVVYVPACQNGATPQGEVLGNIAFHELMHNKLQMGDELHSQPDVRLGSGGDLGPALSVSDGDVRLLAGHLGDEHIQVCP